jgi:RNA polymerase sigma-70 factor (ECF subfamily)
LAYLALLAVNVVVGRERLRLFDRSTGTARMDLERLESRDLMPLVREGCRRSGSFEGPACPEGRGRDAFVVLVRRHQKSLLNFFRRMGARSHEVEDMAQETFLRVFNYRDRYEPTGKFTNFLFVLARHVWADAGRRAQRRPEVLSETLDEGPAPDERGVTRAEARLDVDAALARLSEKLRAVVVLSVYQGLEYSRIAEVLEIPVGTVKSRMHLAMRQLREALGVDVSAGQG